MAPYGIVLSTGNADQYGSGPNLHPDDLQGGSAPYGESYDYNSSAQGTTQETLLENIQTLPSGDYYHDVTELDLKFNVSSAYNSITFQVVFGSEEFSYYLTAYPDAFGVLLNGKNIAKVEAYGPRMNHPTRSNSRYDNSAPIVPEGTLVGQDLGSWNINADHPQMDYVNNVPGHYVEGTELNGVLAPNGVTGNIVMTFTALVTPGATNTLTFIIADSIDGAIDSTAYIANLHATWVDPPAEGMAVPAIEPASEGLMPQALAAEPARVTSFGSYPPPTRRRPCPSALHRIRLPHWRQVTIPPVQLPSSCPPLRLSAPPIR